ncbi:MAG TPA: hypothetical protein VMH35_06660 [Streptosporangiaceae bacterium]|nr:hypothetical protein [Streptosporangiaceae bacterium]
MARQHRTGQETGHQANLNQARHEPVPASRQDERPQAAAQRGEDASRHVAQRRRESGPDDRTPALDSLSPELPGQQPAPAPPGAAAKGLMGGPAPQGPVPGAPGVQVAAADTEDGRVTRIRAVSNAVPGHPDGEVDTRS